MWWAMPPSSPSLPRVGEPVRNDRLAALLVAAREGDRGAFHEIVSELNPLLWHVARSQGLDRDSSADVVQSTWLSLVRSMASIREPKALIGWLVKVTRHEAIRVRDKQRSERSVDTEEFVNLPGADVPPDRRLLDDERRTQLWRAVAKLDPRCQKLLRIVAFVDRPSLEVVSAELGMPKGSIGPTRGRCLAKLRRLLDWDAS
jgi:RNA polymerase sigma factor (sigma-70 family)